MDYPQTGIVTGVKPDPAKLAGVMIEYKVYVEGRLVGTSTIRSEAERMLLLAKAEITRA
jgi:hypothetical protein